MTALALIPHLPNVGEPNDTLVAVVLGALLATLGGFIAARFETVIQRRDRERDAALLLGEIVFTFGMILKMAQESRAIGDPYGSVTVRMLYGAQRECEAYDRNRERLADLTDAPLRIKLHTQMITLSMSLQGVLDATERLAALPAARADSPAAQSLRTNRDNSFDFLGQTAGSLDSLVARLGVIARTSFADHERVVRS